MHPTSRVRVTSSGTEREEIGRGLSRLLADTHALWAKTLRIRRDIGGHEGIVLRPLLARQCRELERATDRIAEHMRALGVAAPRQELRPLLSPVHQGPTSTAEEMIGGLVQRHETVARRIRRVLRLAENAADRATCDLLRQRIDAHDEATWVLVQIATAELLRAAGLPLAYMGIISPRGG
jgi:starvation-inducible DNA-binding protein